MQTVCINIQVLVLIVILLLIIGLYQYKRYSDLMDHGVNTKCPELKCPELKCPESNVITKIVPAVIPDVVHDIAPDIDPVRKYDYNKILDPLAHPARRVPRYEIPPHHLARYIDIPTQGWPDNYHVFGTLLRVNNDDNGDDNNNNTGNQGSDNKILKLFGRKMYRWGDKYEYYASVTSGNEVIKIPITTKRKYKELYDDDVVYVEELGSTYKVKLYAFDAPKYYPDLF